MGQLIHNTLVARELLPKGANAFELVLRFFGYVEDHEKMRKLWIK